MVKLSVMSNVYLVGFMGTGKSAVGRELTQQLKAKFIDLDDLIEARLKRKIADIFAQDGEPAFRQIEKETLREISQEKNLVVACGGGIVLDPENIKIMKSTGKMVCLSATTDVILERTSGYAHRPLLNVENPRQRIEELLKVRQPFYAQADVMIDTSNLSIDEAVEKILEYLRHD